MFVRFGTRITALNALGILFTLCGAFWYRYESELVNKNGHGVKRSVTETRPGFLGSGRFWMVLGGWKGPVVAGFIRCSLTEMIETLEKATTTCC